MRKLITWIVVTLGIAALVRKLKRRTDSAEPSVESATVSADEDPAGELRRKLAETREDETPAMDSAAAPEATVDERRAEVHDQGRAAIDEMEQSAED